MPLVFPANCFEAAFHHKPTGSLREGVCTLGVRNEAAPITNEQIVALQNAWANRIVPSMADNWAYTRFTLRSALGTIYDSSFVVNGATAHTPMPPSVAFLIRKANSQPGRKNRGRMYLPGVSEQDADGVGLVIGSKITELQGVFATFLADLATAELTPVILHTDATPETVITAFTVETLVGTQRRRLRR